MMTMSEVLCLVCSHENVHKPTTSFLKNIIQEDEVYWMGYLLCDPKSTMNSDSPYDIHLNDACNIKLTGVPVKYNHNKNAMSLGKVVAAWHDHDFHEINGHEFAVAFLAHIDNQSFLKSSVNLMMLSETSASLSTLKRDMSVAVEISLCYCGARDGCVGMFLRGVRVAEKASNFGFPEYKRIEASSLLYDHSMTEEETGKNVFEESMAGLPEKEFQTIKETLTETQTSLDTVCKQYEASQEALDLMTKWMTDMIGTRLSLENQSDSEIAQKRRSDLEMLRKRGIIHGGKTDVESLRELMTLCHECYSNDTESKKMADEVLRRFDAQFPELEGKVKRSELMETVDAAFDILRHEMQRKEASALDNRNQKLNKRAMELAKSQYDNIKRQSVTINNGSVQCEDNMSFAAYMNERGLDTSMLSATVDGSNQSTCEPTGKKRKLDESSIESKIPVKWQDDFLKFASERTKKQEDERKKYNQLQEEYLLQREKKKEEKEKNFVELNQNIRDLLHYMKNQGSEGKAEKSTAPKEEISQTVDASLNSTVRKLPLFDL